MDPNDDDQIQRIVRGAKDLIRVLEASSVRRLCLETGDFKVEIEREPAAGERPPLAAPAERAGGAAAPSTHFQVVAPLVGTFFHSPSPGAKPFVEVGARVQRGETVGIIEVMKVMNAVTCDVAGVVVEILAENGHPVQYGQPLMVIDTAAA